MRIGVIGCGRIGAHARRAARPPGPGRGLAAVSDARADGAQAVGAAAACRRRQRSRSCSRAATSTPSRSAPAPTPTPTSIVAAAAAGKAIFCEKPVSLDLAEVDRALAAVEAAGVPFQIGFNRRFDPAHASVRAAVADGAVGDPHLVRITSRDPAPPPIAYIEVSGGIFLDMTIHDFDMARFVTGSEVVEVYARGAVRVDPAIGEAGDVDTAVVVLAPRDGCMTTIDNSRQAVYGYDQRVEAFGSAGMAASENPLAHTGMVRVGRRARAPRRCRTSSSSATSRATSRSGRRSSPRSRRRAAAGRPAADARAPLVIGLAAWRSLREGRPVRL